MARRLIGLDIGTNAVTVAEVRAGDPPRLVMFGQVALARENHGGVAQYVYEAGDSARLPEDLRADFLTEDL